jgi:transcriptional regulator with XRE-family HTH domain
MALPEGAPSAGALLRDWRQRRKLTQLELALRSAVSARHLSFIETGRTRPSREMVLHLAERLDVPLRDRNRLLLAAGFAPAFGERSLDENEMAPVRQALERFLSAHEPYPAVVVDRHWNIVAWNRGVDVVNRGVAPELRTPPANALRIALHPDGLAPRISNLADWSGYLLARLRREIEAKAIPISKPSTRNSSPTPGWSWRTIAQMHRRQTRSCSSTSSASTTETSRSSAPSPPLEPPATSRSPSSRSSPSIRPTRKPRMPSPKPLAKLEPTNHRSGQRSLFQRVSSSRGRSGVRAVPEERCRERELTADRPAPGATRGQTRRS